jgi:hypothetical protein
VIYLAAVTVLLNYFDLKKSKRVDH